MFRPAGQIFGYFVDKGDGAFPVRGDDPVPDAPKSYGQAFLFSLESLLRKQR
jgi:hypothetical protein